LSRPTSECTNIDFPFKLIAHCLPHRGIFPQSTDLGANWCYASSLPDSCLLTVFLLLCHLYICINNWSFVFIERTARLIAPTKYSDFPKRSCSVSHFIFASLSVECSVDLVVLSFLTLLQIPPYYRYFLHYKCSTNLTVALTLLAPSLTF